METVLNRILEGYEIINFKDYNQPGIVSTQMKLTQKVDHLLCLRASCSSIEVPAK